MKKKVGKKTVSKKDEVFLDWAQVVATEKGYCLISTKRTGPLHLVVGNYFIFGQVVKDEDPDKKDS